MAVVESADAPVVDTGLVRRMAQGDEEAAYRLLEAHGDALVAFVRRRISGSTEDAEEIVQDAFVAAVRMGSSYDGSCSVFTWLCCLARLKVADYARANASRKRTAMRDCLRFDDETRRGLRKVHDPSVPLETIVEQIDRVRVVQALLDLMTPDQREAVTLRYVERFTVAEVARIMGRSEKAIERLIERAKERPRQEMVRWFGEESFRAVCFEVLVL